jgi:hypothetical protein
MKTSNSRKVKCGGVLARAQRKVRGMTGIRFERAYAQELPFVDGEFDRALSSMMLQFGRRREGWCAGGVTSCPASRWPLAHCRHRWPHDRHHGLAPRWMKDNPHASVRHAAESLHRPAHVLSRDPRLEAICGALAAVSAVAAPQVAATSGFRAGSRTPRRSSG